MFGYELLEGDEESSLKSYGALDDCDPGTMTVSMGLEYVCMSM